MNKCKCRKLAAVWVYSFTRRTIQAVMSCDCGVGVSTSIPETQKVRRKRRKENIQDTLFGNAI